MRTSRLRSERRLGPDSASEHLDAYADDAARLATPLERPDDLEPLLERIGDARFVLLGEASHGTHEYYTWRAEITKRLIADKGFSFVAVEGDWPDCYRVNRWLKTDDGTSGRSVLQSFERWPTWMWANEEVAQLVEWLRAHNLERRREDRVGFYGLDVYSLWDSMRAVIGYLERHDHAAVETARRAWRCFEPYREDPQEYAWATRIVPTSCEDEVVSLLGRLNQDAAVVGDDPETRFDAEQNAAVAAGAERYYRAMVRGGATSWNIRDTHMTETLERLVERHGPRSKAVVWEHNTHVGDARATDMSASGMVNVGQLVRERRGDEGVVLVGFAGYDGSVIAADAWGAPMERMPVPAATGGSHEDVVRRAGLGNALFVIPAGAVPWLDATLGHRAIGVVYHPERERGNYVPTELGRRYDALCHFETTTALRPLGWEEPQEKAELETFPLAAEPD
ncbi:MAG: erythromycin esterase family protein [Actinomycetota bacterium]|nr:erythromycin esterase family protein [Actinomycetota bacterium]